jgi:hypothetical protein
VTKGPDPHAQTHADSSSFSFSLCFHSKKGIDPIDALRNGGASLVVALLNYAHTPKGPTTRFHKADPDLPPTLFSVLRLPHGALLGSLQCDRLQRHCQEAPVMLRLRVRVVPHSQAPQRCERALLPKLLGMLRKEIMVVGTQDGRKMCSAGHEGAAWVSRNIALLYFHSGTVLPAAAAVRRPPSLHVGG